MIGQALAHFQITAKLGEGGMGEVYRAEDTRLGRDVAIKVLPEGLTSNEERLARFEREARLLASINHPNIAALYEVGESGSTHFLVMELVEGETIAERLRRGPIPLPETMALALQVAEALEEAHAKGIIHRDLKPANISVTPSGQVKVLDFGLAKAFEPAGAAAAAMTQSPTLTAQMTGAGVILGTAAYMAPEQAKGMEADKRSDIWAFGVVLTEMLSGKQPFVEGTVTETLAAVLKSDPDLQSLPPGLPLSLHRLIERCLRKNPRERLHDIADARLVLQDILEGRDTSVSASDDARRPRPLLVAALVAAGLVAGFAASLLFRPSRVPATESHPPLQYVIEYGSFYDSNPRISPDGSHVAYERDGAIWVRDLARLEPVQIGNTEGGVLPVWSPDGDWLAFGVQGRLWKIKLDGTGRVLLGEPGPDATASGAVWLDDGRILLVTGSSGIYEIPDRGGDARLVLSPEEDEADFHNLSPLPGGRGFLFSVHAGDTFDNVTLWDGEKRKTLLRLPGQALGGPAYSPTGHILFNRSPRGTGIWAVPFSLDSLEVTGDPFPVAPRGRDASLSTDGTLVYGKQAPGLLSELVILDTSGAAITTVASARGLYPNPALSPDGRSIAVPIASELGYDLWRYEVDGGKPTRLTFEDTASMSDPTWSPDGTKIYFSWSSSTEDFAVRVLTPDGSGQVEDLVRGRGPVAFTSDDSLIWGSYSGGFNWNLSMSPIGNPAAGEVVLGEDGWEQYPSISPDGRLLAYEHRGNVLIRTLPELAGPWQIPGGGLAPKWSRERNRLFYHSGQSLMAVDVTTDPAVTVGSPRQLFTVDLAPSEQTFVPTFDVGPNETFVVVRPLEPPPGIVVVHDWLGTIE